MEPDRTDRRRGRRYDLDLPFDYRAFGQDQSVQEGHGRTLNMGSHGLLVAPDQQVGIGQPIEITIQLPAHSEQLPDARLVILGHVLRSGKGDAAIKIMRHGFVRVQSREAAAEIRVGV